MASNKVDIKKLKSRLKLSDYKKIMEALDIPLYMEGNDALIYYSGEKYKDFQNHSAKLYLYKDSKIFVGYTSNRSYDIIALVQTRLNLLGQTCSFMDAVKFIMSTVGLAREEVTRINKKHIYDWESDLGKYVRFRNNISELPVYNPTILLQLDSKYPLSWIKEGISIESMQKYHIGYYERTNSTTIPCFSEYGELNGIRVRNWNPVDIESGKKYMPLQLLDNTIYKFPTNNTFYGINYNKPIIESKGHVILVEGEKSVLKADTFWDNNSNVLALYGSTIGSKRRNDLIKMGVNHITFALDSDFHEIGDEEYQLFEKKILNLASLFKGYADIDVVYNNIGLENAYKASPFDFDEETWNRLYEAREVII